jgi:hypothetical protein
MQEKMKIRETGYTGMKRNTPFTSLNPGYLWSEGVDLELPERRFLGRMENIAKTLWPGELENSTKGKTFR